MNTTLEHLPAILFQNKTDQSVLFQQPLFSVEIVCLLILFLLLFPYLNMAACCSALYGGMIGFYYLKRTIFILRNGFTKLEDFEARDWIIKWISLYGTVWHSHEVIGLENIPNEPTLFVLYHGPIPVDAYFLYAKLIKLKKRLICAVVNENHFKMFCLTGVFKSIRAGAWSRDQCVEILKTGADICILPGGKYESRMSDYKYKLEWGHRKGFAKVALAAKTPIVPVFTKNIQEAFWTPWYAKPFTQGKYSKKKQFLNIIVGGLPVKLVTVIGKPIIPDETTAFEELAALTKDRMQQLIDSNQIVPGSIWRALKERITGSNVEDNNEIEEFCLEKELKKSHRNENGATLNDVVFEV